MAARTANLSHCAAGQAEQATTKGGSARHASNSSFSCPANSSRKRRVSVAPRNAMSSFVRGAPCSVPDAQFTNVYPMVSHEVRKWLFAPLSSFLVCHITPQPFLLFSLLFPCRGGHVGQASTKPKKAKCVLSRAVLFLYFLCCCCGCWPQIFLWFVGVWSCLLLLLLMFLLPLSSVVLLISHRAMCNK